ncbi:tripartite tricarboxylate transporter TctB family protein [Paracoccus sp. S3-43]|uniref:tripartite tricarboxylate transporter TctB family protein n=1 Tax=Paracoccus sp. S3-43 TaxID=3030011 RepID=UPI0023B1A3CB|nr:tripartite tricarboxylate transporter TctB family protein [Paracoccus sp. S3-43]WEF24690.1 tripartite tricarboxylate transporter TctB family protein [Paracoccus sp. S3-43]
MINLRSSHGLQGRGEMNQSRGDMNLGDRGLTLRSSQNLVGGLVLLGLAALALWLTRDLSQGTLGEMGPAMLPRWLAVGVGLCGLALLAGAFLQPGEALEGWHLRGPAMVTAGIVAFALTIRSFPLGSVTTSGLGLVIAGPLSILISSFATSEATLRERLCLALGLTGFCMVLFADVLNLPIPLFPRSMQGWFPTDWGMKAPMRLVAVTLIAATVVLILLGRKGNKTGEVPHV